MENYNFGNSFEKIKLPLSESEQEPAFEKSVSALWADVTSVYPYTGNIPEGFKAGEMREHVDENGQASERPANIIDVEIEKNYRECAEKIQQILHGLFKNSGPLVEKLLGKTRPEQTLLCEIASKLGLPENYFDSHSYEIYFHSYMGPKTQQAETVYFMAAFLNQAPIPSEEAGEKIRQVLKGKKILVIGDDFGTMSETLNALGAETTGVEYDQDFIRIAKSGVLAEDEKPQDQVLQGNAWDIGDSNSALFKTLKEKGPFDMVYSYAVFNGGSGFLEDTKRDSIGDERFHLGMEELLKEEGIQLHARSEPQAAFLRKVSSAARGYEREMVGQDRSEAKELLNKMNKEISENYVWRGGAGTVPFRISDSEVVRGKVLTRIEPLLKEAREAHGIMKLIR